MTISQAIASLTLCLEKFGDVECKFTSTSGGNPAIELQNVDSSKPKPIPKEDPLYEEAVRRFNARFPTRDIFIPSRN